MKSRKINSRAAGTQQADKKEPVIGQEMKKLYVN